MRNAMRGAGLGARAGAVTGTLLAIAVAAFTAATNGFHAFGDTLRLTAALAIAFALPAGGVGLAAGAGFAAIRRRGGGGEAAFAIVTSLIAAVWTARWFEFNLAYPQRWPFVDGFGGMLAVAIAFVVLLAAGAAAFAWGLARAAIALRPLGITAPRALAGAGVAALAVGIVIALRAAPVPDPALADVPPVVRPNANRVLLIGCDGADPRAIDVLLAGGEMPNLRALIERGVRAPLRTLADRPSPALWTSIAASRSPRDTGISDFYVQEVLGASAPVEAFPRHFGLNAGLLLRDILGTKAIRVNPVSAPMVRTRRLWEILGAAGVPVGVVNWLVTWPAAAGDAEFVVSDRTYGALCEGDAPDAGDGEALALWDPPAVAAALPGADELPETEDAFVAETAVRLMEDRAPQVMIAYFRDVDAAEHLAWDRWEPRFFRGRKGAPPHAGPVRDAYLAFDRHLGALVDAAGPRTTVILVSDHGHGPWFTWLGRGTPGGHTDAPDGILVAAGPTVRAGAPFDAPPTIHDVTPTVLRIVGLPAAANMEGRVLDGILDDAAPITAIASWEAGRAPLDGKAPQIEDEAMLERLRALGYLR